MTSNVRLDNTYFIINGIIETKLRHIKKYYKL